MSSTLVVASSRPAAAIRGLAPPALAPNVLLVDDCRLQRLYGTAVLARWRIAPALASNGRQAVVLAAVHDFDIILMDLDMPILDGFAATRAIRLQEGLAGRRRVPVVAYTATDGACSEDQWRRCGMDDVLGKPSKGAELLERLRRWCPHRQVVESSPAAA